MLQHAKLIRNVISRYYTNSLEVKLFMRLTTNKLKQDDVTSESYELIKNAYVANANKFKIRKNMVMPPNCQTFNTNHSRIAQLTKFRTSNNSL